MLTIWRRCTPTSSTVYWTAFYPSASLFADSVRQTLGLTVSVVLRSASPGPSARATVRRDQSSCGSCHVIVVHFELRHHHRR